MGNGFSFYKRKRRNKILKHIQVTVLLICTIASAQEKTDRDTIYQSAPVTITATHAVERSSPVTFSNLNHSEIQKQYSVQDVPVLLSGLPSITFYSENGNSSGGYSYINLRGFEQQRLSVMVNGVPQNDPEDFSVYWIDFPDLLGSTANIQVQRGAGSAFYGPPAIGGSVNILAVPFQSQPSVLFESSLGFQEYGSTNTIFFQRANIPQHLIPDSWTTDICFTDGWENFRQTVIVTNRGMKSTHTFLVSNGLTKR